jgi:hypothetical protein
VLAAGRGAWYLHPVVVSSRAGTTATARTTEKTFNHMIDLLAKLDLSSRKDASNCRF